MKLIIFPTIGTNYNVPVNMDVVTNMVPTPSAGTIAFVSGVTTIFTYTANNFTSVLNQIYAFLSNASQTILTVVAVPQFLFFCPSVPSTFPLRMIL